MNQYLLPICVVWSVATSAQAGTVLVLEPGGDAATSLTETLANELPGHAVSRMPRPKGWREAAVDQARRVGDVARAQKMDVVVDLSTAQKGKQRSLTVVAVSADDEVVFERSVRLPAPPKRGRKPDLTAIRRVTRELAQAIQDRLRNAQGGAAGARPIAPAAAPVVAPPARLDGDAATVSPAPPPASSATPPPSAPGTTSPRAEPAVLLTTPPPSVQKETPSRRRREWHLAARVGAGVTSFSDSIDTEVQGGDLAINMAPTLALGGGVEFRHSTHLWLALDANRASSGMSHESKNNALVTKVAPTTIDINTLTLAARVGTGFEFGDLTVGPEVGFARDSLTAADQSLANTEGGVDPVVLVPSFTRSTVRLGGRLLYGTYADKGLTADLWLAAVPWGKQSETPYTSGSSAKLMGAELGARARYQIPDLLGEVGGAFLELHVGLEYLGLTYSGTGTRRALVSGVAVVDATETRTRFDGGAYVGYLF